MLLDIPRMLGMPHLPDTFAITSEMLNQAERHFGVEVRRGDYLLVRTGQMEAMQAANTWDGYSGGDAPGLAFETLDWLHARQVAAIADGRRNFRSRGAGARLRRRQALRIHVRRACLAGDGRRGLAGESTGNQMKAKWPQRHRGTEKSKNRNLIDPRVFSP